MRRLIVVVALALAACGLPDAPGALGPPLNALCGPISLDWPVPSPPDANFEPFEGDLDEYVDANARVEFDMDTPTEWSIVEESGSALLLFGRHTEEAPDGPGYRYARFEKGEEGWRATQWGGCQIEASAEGYGVATFHLDPASQPDPAATTIDVLANERACASGEAPDDREVVPVVVETDESVDITILVQSSLEGENCPSNPDFPLTIELSSPLGERTIRDLALQPAEERTWPPSESDLAP